MGEMTTGTKRRPWGTVWGIRGGPNETPWTRPLNDTELADLGLEPEEYEPVKPGEGKWS